MKISYTLTAAFAGLVSAQGYSGPLYVWGDSSTAEINNLKIFSNGEKIYLGDYNALNDPEYAPVIFSLDTSKGDTKLYLNPNTTGLSQKPTWSNRILAEPSYTGGSGLKIVAIDPNAADIEDYRARWFAYGSALFAATNNGDASYSGREYAEKSGIAGVWDVYAYWIGSAGKDHFVFRNKYITN